MASKIVKEREDGLPGVAPLHSEESEEGKKGVKERIMEFGENNPWKATIAATALGRVAADKIVEPAVNVTVEAAKSLWKKAFATAAQETISDGLGQEAVRGALGIGNIAKSVMGGFGK